MCFLVADRVRGRHPDIPKEEALMRRSLMTSAVALLALVAGHREAPVPTAVPPSTLDAIRQLKALPIAFETNVGQTDPAASFVARGEGYVVWATEEGPVVRVGAPRSDRRATARLRVVGGGSAGHPAPESLLPGRSNYFIGNDPAHWKQGVPRYGALRYADVYEGVDLVLHGTQESLEYDFDVAPHADPARIGVAFEGATAMRLEPDGDLTLSVDGGELSFRPPVAYQETHGERTMVPARYELGADQVIRFALGDYDPTRPLVIDPVLSYSTYLGGANAVSAERAWDVAVDASGHAIVAGYTNAVDFPLAGTSFDTTCGGCTNSGVDAWVARIDPSQSGAASLVFSTYLGAQSTGPGTGSSMAYAVAVDGGGNVYVAGNTSGFDNASTPSNESFPTTANAFQPTDGGDLAVLDAFLTKLDPTGSTLLYSTYIGGNNVDEASAVSVDDTGNAYVAGWAASTNFPALVNGFRLTNTFGGFDGFVVKFDTTLGGGASLKYGTLLGGHSQDRIGGLALDASGRVYVTGLTQSAGSNSPEPFPVKNGFQMASLGGQDAFMTAIDTSASGANSLLYSTLISSDGTENGALGDGAIAVDGDGIVYVAGTTSGGVNGLFPATSGAYKSVAVSSDAYVVKIDPLQIGGPSLLASTLVGGSGQEGGSALTIDQSGNPVLAGWTGSADFGATGCALPKLNGVDGFVTVLDPSLTGLKYSTPIGGWGTDHVYGVAVGPSGLLYLAGYTDSNNFPTTSTDSATTTAAFDPTHQGGQDAFLSVLAAVLDPCPVPPTAANLATNTPEDTPKALTLTASDPGGNSAPPETLTWSVVTGPSHGTLDATSGVMAHGFASAYSVALVYTPASNYTGADSFTFVVIDGTADSNVATVSIAVSPVNDAPTAHSQSVTTAEESPKLITLAGSDPENQFLTYSIGDQPLNGVLSGTGASRTYTPNQDFAGEDAFTFYVTDSFGLSSPYATVTITVTNVNDAPVTAADAATTQEDVAVTVGVLDNDTDVDADTLTVTALSCNNGASATVNPDQTVTVTPPANFSGTITCSYTADDGHGGAAAGHLIVTVNAVNDAPVATDEDASTVEDVPVNVAVLSNDSDADGDALLVTAVSCSSGAVAAVNPDQSITVTPALNFHGVLTCSYTAADGHGGTTTGSVTITVTPVNDDPFAAPDQAGTDDNTLIIVPVLANDADPDGDPLTLGSVGPCQQGTVTANLDGTVTYVPKQGFGGTDVCAYTAVDPMGGIAAGELTVIVTVVNEPPELGNPGDQQTDEGSAVSLQITAGDPDSDTLTFGASGLPAGLSIDPQTGLISGAPAAGSAGSHQVTFWVTDEVNEPVTASFVWVVSAPNGVNLPPVCTTAQASQTTLWPPDHRLVPIQIDGVTDPDGSQPAIVVTRILQDEPTNTFGDGSTWIDGFGVGTSIAQIRAERVGTPRVPGDGRIYEIGFTATDAQGATCSGSVLISVPRDQSVGAAIDSGVRYDSTVAGAQPVIKP
jgi:hypothetical protein